MTAQTSEPVGVAVIGAGRIGRHRLEQLSLSPSFRVAGVHDVRKESHDDLERLAPESARNRSWRSVLEDPDISTVWLATPPGTHAMLAFDALNAGKHLVVEPPLCLTLREAAEIGRSAQRRERHLLSTARIDASPDVFAAVETRLSGEPVRTASFISQCYNPPAFHYSDSRAWRHDPASGGGVLWQQGRRVIEDLCTIIGSEPQSVYATLDLSDFADHGRCETGFTLIVGFRCGARGRVLVSRGSLVPLETGWMVEFASSAGSPTSRYHVAPDGELVDVPVTPPRTSATMDVVLRRLSECARLLRRPQPTDDDWCLMQRTVAIVLAAQDSVAKRMVVAVEG
jgi:predicted dehydrogenase